METEVLGFNLNPLSLEFLIAILAWLVLFIWQNIDLIQTSPEKIKPKNIVPFFATIVLGCTIAAIMITIY